MSGGGRSDTVKLERFELAERAFVNLVSKGAICAKGRMLKFMHAANNDTSKHSVLTCTVAFGTKSWSN